MSHGANRFSSDRSLWRELVDGSAGPVVRLLVNLALAAMMIGLCLAMSFLIAWADPSLNYRARFGGVAPDEELIAICFAVGSVIFLAMTIWLWSRGSRRRAFWFAAVMTVATWATAIPIAILLSELIRDDGIIAGAIVAFAFAGTLLFWVHAFYRYGRGRATHNAADGRLDVICPECGYRMVGLHESRCPECGTAYTLDELLARQDFREAPVTGTGVSVPPLPPRRAGGGAEGAGASSQHATQAHFDLPHQR